MSSRCMAARPASRRRGFCKSCCIACPLRSRPCRWTAEASSLRNSRKPASRNSCRCLCSHPKSPKLNAHVERSHRTHHEEFYQVSADSDHLPVLNDQLRRWEHTYNCVRPHQSLAYLTPLEFITRWKHNPRKAQCH